jgi:hydroxymethylpyrimidine/phosphomethylpyrimidine kinase
MERQRASSMNSPDQQRSEVLHELLDAVGLLSTMDPRLVPENGANIGFAMAGARDGGGVAAVRDGIGLQGDLVIAAGPCMFGADMVITRIVLTAMKFDPAIRSVAVIRYSGSAVRILEEMLLECCSFDQTKEPLGISTMDWGVASCCRDGVPDVIYDRGTREKEPVIRFFGEHPANIANNIIMLSNRVLNIEL